MSNKKIPEVGTKFGYRTYIGGYKSNGNQQLLLLCRCKCGKEKYIRGYMLRQGTSKMCRSCSSSQCKVTHGLSHSRFYRIRDGIKKRCNSKTHPYYNIYGGRGIKVEWNSFKEFMNDMYKSYIEHVNKYGEKNTTIDRIDVDGNYNKDNCRRTTRSEQNKNRRCGRYYENKINKILLYFNNIIGLNETN